MRPKLIRVLFQVALVFVLLLGFVWMITAASEQRRSPWAAAVLVAIVAIARGIYMWRRTPPNSPAKLVK